MHHKASERVGVAEATANVLGDQRNRAENDDASGDRRGRNRRGSRAAPAISDDAIARLTERAVAQRETLRSRLVSHDPTRKQRDAHAKRQEHTDGSRRRHRGDEVSRPISRDRFAEKYSVDDPMLHYLLGVIAEGKSVTRAEIPRRPEGIDVVRRQFLPEEDVLFLVYHRSPPCGFRNVYWLEFISENRAIDIEVEYFTLSHHGLTHYRGSNVIDFVDIDAWITEKRAFDYMTTMRGLQKLQGLLFFMSWKKKAIRLKHRRVRDRLATSLFHCDIAASRLIVSIRGCCVEIEDYVSANQLPIGFALPIESITDDNRARIRSVRCEVLRQVGRICDVVLQELSCLRHQRDFEIEEGKQNYANISRSSRLLDRLYVFLRLTEFHLLESIYMHMKEFVVTLYNQICGSDTAKLDCPMQSEAKVSLGCIPGSSEDILPAFRLKGSNNAAETIVSYKIQFRLQHRHVPAPFLYARMLERATSLNGFDSLHTELSVIPPQHDVFDLIYTLLNGYIACLDGIPRILADERFGSVLGPHTPQSRDAFLASLLRPSSQILLSHKEELKGMRFAIETYYKQLEIQLTDRLRLLEKVYDIQCDEDVKKASNEHGQEYQSRVLTAAQYEEIRGAWEKVLHEVTTQHPFIQVGIFLVDQSSLVDRLKTHVDNHIHDMMGDLPSVYMRFLYGLLMDVDGRIERVMNIPTSITDAIKWLKEVTEMMPRHAFRRAFDAKCENLARLKQLLKDNNLFCQTMEEQDVMRKKEFEWDSLYETLITCFLRVQERDSEHRRSILELSAKADDYISAQMGQIKAEFSKIPSHQDEMYLSQHKAKELAKKKQLLIERLERLVALDGERQEMLESHLAFEHEHRLATDQGDAEILRTSRKWETKPLSEQLLQHLSIVIDMRSWFCAWSALEDKWLDTPLTSMHASLVLSRLKQFHRRLQFASTRLLPIASTDSDEGFVARDHSLVEDIRSRVDQAAREYVFLQAATCGAFTNEKWIVSQPLLGSEYGSFIYVTLRSLRERSIVSPQSVLKFKQLCEIVVIESKLKSSAERLRQRLHNCRITVISSNSHVAFASVQDVVYELDDVEIETKLLSQTKNPNLNLALDLLHDIRSSSSLCGNLLAFQALWGELCQIVCVPDIDEFFTGHVAWKGPIQRQKKKTGRDESVWSEFVETIQDWSERIRHLVCVSQSSAAPTPGQVDFSITEVLCSLADVEEAFHAFDFEAGTARCELAHQLIDKYLLDLRIVSPRLYLLDKKQLIHLLVREIDSKVVCNALGVCYRHVQSFTMTRGLREDVSQSKRLSVSRSVDSQGTLVIKGFTTTTTSHEFNVPIVKVGRLRFWMARLEEELRTVVSENVKQATTKIFSLVESPSEVVQYSLPCSHLTQSILVALTLWFTGAVERAFQSSPNYAFLLSDQKESHIRTLEGVIRLLRSSGVNRCDARLETIVILLSYQIEVLEELCRALDEGKDSAELYWQYQTKIDFMVDDLTTKTARRVRCCDAVEWRNLATLGPSFPITYFASVGRCEIKLGHELASTDRIPLITPITQRCVYEIAQALRGLSSPLLGVINSSGYGGQRTVMRGIAQLLMKPLLEFNCSTNNCVDSEVFSGFLQTVSSMGSIVFVHHFEILDSKLARNFVERINQTIREVCLSLLQIQDLGVDHRGALPSAAFGGVVIPLDKSSLTTTQQVLFGSAVVAFRPVSIILPPLSSFIKTMALLAGFLPAEMDIMRPVLTFFECLSKMSTSLVQSSLVYRLVSIVMKEVSQLRYTHRVLLPSDKKWSHQFSGAGRRSGPRRMSNFFRRSADAQDTSEVVVHTLFKYVLSERCGGLVARALDSQTDSLPDDVTKLLECCFPSAEGCDLIDKASGTMEEALWEALKMSYESNGLVASSNQLEKALELFKAIESSRAVVVIGGLSSGKTTCIRNLHKAIEALELARLTNEGCDTIDQVPRKTSQLVWMSSRYLDLEGLSIEQLERIIRQTFDQSHEDIFQMTNRWLCIDGDLYSSIAERMLVGFGHQGSLTMSSLGCPRVIFETLSLKSSSPALFAQTRLLHIPSKVTQGDVIAAWRELWMKKLPFPEDSRGAENLEKVLQMTEYFISGPVQQLVLAEECSTNSSSTVNKAKPCHLPTHFGMLSLLHLTQSTLQFISTACLNHRSLLEEASPGHLTRLIAFCVVWGFTGHLNESYRGKLELLILPLLKQDLDSKRLGDLHDGLSDSENISAGLWEMMQLPLRGVETSALSGKDQQKSFVTRTLVDGPSGRILVLPSATLAIVRLMRLLLRFDKSFVLVGPRGCGKSSILRLVWAMNIEDISAESMIDASFDHRTAPNILNWQDKPRTWFHYPRITPSEGSQTRARSSDEADLFASLNAGAAKFVFLDDLGFHFDRASEVEPMDEFVRITLDHRMSINWTGERVLPLYKAFGATMVTHQAAVPRLRAPIEIERLLRHFCVFRVPTYNRQQIQGIFRQVFTDFLPRAEGSNPRQPATSSSIQSNERVLTPWQVILRAGVDVAVDLLTIQQTSDKFSLIEGFTFNFHHLNELLRRSLSFSLQLTKVHGSGTIQDGEGATLLTLGKLHQCWASSVRQVFLTPILHHAPPGSVEVPSAAELAVGDVKKAEQSVKLVGEKYFSVPAREESHAALVTDIVYGVHRFLMDDPKTSEITVAKAAELLAANASASSSSCARRNGVSEGNGPVLARDEYILRVARELILTRVKEFLHDKSERAQTMSTSAQLRSRLHLGSSVGLHQLLHILQAIHFSSNILVDQQPSPIQRDVFRLAFAIEGFEVIQLDAQRRGLRASFREKLESTLLAVAGQEKKIALWVDIDRIQNHQDLRDVIEAVYAACMGKIQPILFDSTGLRDEVVTRSIHDQEQLGILSRENAIARSQSVLKEQFRFCIVSTGANPTVRSLVESLRASATFQWVSLVKAKQDYLRYRSEVVRRAIQEICGIESEAISRDQNSRNSHLPGVASWSSLYAECESLFHQNATEATEEKFLTFVVNVVASCKSRISELDARIANRQMVVDLLQRVSGRVPQLQIQSALLGAKIDQLTRWHDELQEPLAVLQREQRERGRLLQEQEAELSSDELRSLSRKLEKIVNQIWAHKSMICEYDLARSEAVLCQRDVLAELHHWDQYHDPRDSIGRSYTEELEALLLLRRDSCGLIKQCVHQIHAVSHSCSEMREIGRESMDNSTLDKLHQAWDLPDQVVYHLWLSRFPFLNCTDQTKMLLPAIDRVYDRIPLVVDRNGIFQYILVHLFSNVPWFSDGNEERDHRESIGFTTTGTIAPAIIQCDGSPKMWQKLNEAAQKQVPTLLVGVSDKLLEPLSHFAQQHVTAPRSSLLKELTLESYRSQLKRDAQQAKPLPSTNSISISVAPPGLLNSKKNRRPGVASADLKWVSSVLDSASETKVGGHSEPAGSRLRRGSFVVACDNPVVSPQGFGFQLYAVTQHVMDEKLAHQGGQFTVVDVHWDPCSIESFFNEGFLRRYDKKLHKHLVETRRILADSTYAISQSERQLSSLVRSPSCLSPVDREPFMEQLQRLADDCVNHEAHRSQAPSRLAALLARQRSFHAVGRSLSLVAQSASCFGLLVDSRLGGNTSSYRFFKQLLDVTVSALMKHTQDIRVAEQEGSCKMPRLSTYITTQALQSVLAGLRSPAHQRAWLMILATMSQPSSSTTPDHSGILSCKGEMKPVVAWLLHEGIHQWHTSIQIQNIVEDKRQRSVSQSLDPDDFTPTDTLSAATPSPVAPTSAGLSLVERLRRKVRICSLIFDRMGNREKPDELQSKSRRSTANVQTHNIDFNGKLHSPDRRTLNQEAAACLGPREVLQKDFRALARTAKMLWCEWRLVKEDQRADLRCIVSVLTRSSAANPFTVRRRRRSVKDILLAPSTVTQILNLEDIVAGFLDLEAPTRSAAKSMEERLVFVMVAKSCFLHLFQDEWLRFLQSFASADFDDVLGSASMSTSQLLGLNPLTNDVHQGDARKNPTLLPTQATSLLPPSIDVAWRRDDLIHLPTRLIVYEPTTERATVEVLLLRASASTQADPVQVFTIVSFDESASRLEGQLTAVTTNKERFAVEIQDAEQFDRIVALVSQIINQHALLCVPEWYVICTFQVLDQVESPFFGFLHVHVVSKNTEAEDLTSQLMRWLVDGTGLDGLDARVAAISLISRASDAPPIPLRRASELLVSQAKAITQSRETLEKQREMKRQLVSELQDVSLTKPGGNQSIARTQSSLEFLSELLLLPPPKLKLATTSTGSADEDQTLPPLCQELIDQVDAICVKLLTLLQEGDANRGSLSSATFENDLQKWRSWATEDARKTITTARSFVARLRSASIQSASRVATLQSALVRHGLVPTEWFTEHFSTLSQACLSNIVSIPQVVVLLVSRIGFHVDHHSGEHVDTLHSSLLHDFGSALDWLRGTFASRKGFDPADVVFVLEAGGIGTDNTARTEPRGVPKVSNERRNSQILPRGLGGVGLKCAATAKQVTPYLVLNEDGLLCGILVSGLVAVEKFTSKGGSNVLIHELPACRLTCQRRQEDIAGVNSSRASGTENAITTLLRHQGTRLTTIISTSAFQHIPEDFWNSSSAADPSTILHNVTCAASVLASVPSLSPQRADQDTTAVVFAVPVFPADDKDHD